MNALWSVQSKSTAVVAIATCDPIRQSRKREPLFTGMHWPTIYSLIIIALARETW